MVKYLFHRVCVCVMLNDSAIRDGSVNIQDDVQSVTQQIWSNTHC